jgi:hypothetical protein
LVQAVSSAPQLVFAHVVQLATAGAYAHVLLAQRASQGETASQMQL